MEPTFYYRGEPILIGDIVSTGDGRLGKVVGFTGPGSVSEFTGEMSSGGEIMIEEDWEGRPSLLLIEPYGMGWEDFDFVRRGDTHDEAAET